MTPYTADELHAADQDARSPGHWPETPPPAAGPAPPAADRAAAQAEIKAIREDAAHPLYTPHREGNKAAVDAMQALYHRAYGAPDPDAPDTPAFTRPSARYELDVPDHLTEATLPTILRQDAQSTTFELGFDKPTAQGVFEWALGRAAAPPDLPPCRTTYEAATKSLQNELGADFDRQHLHYNAGVKIMDALRERAGHAGGQIVDTLRRSGYDNDPKVFKFFARLGSYYKQTEPELFRQFAAQWRPRIGPRGPRARTASR